MKAVADHTELHLVRHGETDWNALGRVQGQAESRLTDRGRAQATALGKSLDPTAFHGVYCSSSVRTRQTLDCMLGDRRCAVRYQDNLREIHLGPWQRVLRADVEVAWPGPAEDFRMAPAQFSLEGAESFHDLQARAVKALLTIARAHLGRRVLVVSHGALIKVVHCRAAGLTLDSLWSPPHAENCARCVISVSVDNALTATAFHAGGDHLLDD